MEYVDVNGTRLAFAVSGEPGARPLVLLHGGGNDRSAWDRTAPTLARSHRVYAIDLRGFGDSGRPGKYSFELMRDDVLGLMDAVGADRFDVIGHSMGGTVAWLLAQRQPHRITHLVVADTPLPKEGLEIDPGPRPEPEPPFDWDALVAGLAQIAEPDPAWWPRMSMITAKALTYGQFRLVRLWLRAFEPSDDATRHGQHVVVAVHANRDGPGLVEVPAG